MVTDRVEGKQVEEKRYPQIKICGLTVVAEAIGCVEAGADAIGLVFFPKSPRHVSNDTAKEIASAVSDRAKSIGVFVNASFEEIMGKASHCGLSGVQLHGQESPELVQTLRDQGLIVIKGLFPNTAPLLTEAARYPASAFLAECSKGPLPGGNALVWDWGMARDLGARHPLLLAGGLTPENVEQAIFDALPLGVDVSSGVEVAPGRKSLGKVAAFVAAVSRSRDALPDNKTPLIFS